MLLSSKEVHGLRPGGVDSHLGHLTLNWELLQVILKRMAVGFRIKHIILKEQGGSHDILTRGTRFFL